jgi:hypothetical protein
MTDTSFTAYDDFLDEVCEEIQIGSLSYSPSFALQRVDPIAYRVGYSEWLDSVEEDADYHAEPDMDRCG